MQVTRPGGSSPLHDLGPARQEAATTGAAKTAEGAADKAGAAVPDVASDSFTRAPSALGGPFAGGLGSLPQGDIAGLVMTVMQQAVRDANADLRGLLEQLEANNDRKQALREAVGALRAGEVDRLLDGQPATTTGGFQLQLSEDGGAAVSAPDGKVLLRAIPQPGAPGPLSIGDLLAGQQPTINQGIALELADGPLADQLAAIGQAGGVVKEGVDAVVDGMKRKLDSLSEMGEMESLRLQMAMDRLSKMTSTLSNLLKKLSDTASTITQNIK